MDSHREAVSVSSEALNLIPVAMRGEGQRHAGIRSKNPAAETAHIWTSHAQMVPWLNGA
jgi:hypothetical protein